MIRGSGLEVGGGNGWIVKGVGEDLANRRHGLGIGINRKGASQLLTEAPAVVHAHNVIRVSMGDQDGIHHPNSFPETLKSHLGCGVDEQADAVGFDKDGWARSMVLWVGKECLRIGGADHRTPMEVPEPKTTTLKLEWLVSISVMHLFSWRDASTEGRLETNINSMLTTLRIKNLALVDDLTLELSEGLNIITGETGAGKSIIMGALNLILGQRADRSLIRSGADQCVIEAVFQVGGEILPVLESILEAWGLEPCQDQTLFLKRSMRPQVPTASSSMDLPRRSKLSHNWGIIWWTCMGLMIINPSWMGGVSSRFWMPLVNWKSTARLSASH